MLKAICTVAQCIRLITICTTEYTMRKTYEEIILTVLKLYVQLKFQCLILYTIVWLKTTCTISVFTTLKLYLQLPYKTNVKLCIITGIGVRKITVVRSSSCGEIEAETKNSKSILQHLMSTLYTFVSSNIHESSWYTVYAL